MDVSMYGLCVVNNTLLPFELIRSTIRRDSNSCASGKICASGSSKTKNVFSFCKTERNYNPEKDRKNIMNLVKPLSEKEIKKLRHGKLQIFIDDIISNKKVNHLLFSHNAKKELAFFYRQQNQVLK